MENLYTQAPLPFMGQKRKFVKEFRTALKNFDDSYAFIDLFGGSGLLSHVVHHERPDAIVIYNDYDDYHLRVDNIGKTNALLRDIRFILSESGCESGKIIPQSVKGNVLDRIKTECGFVDYITLSSSLLFSMNYCISYDELSKATMYNCIKQNDYRVVGYFDGIDIVKKDYKELYYEWNNYPNVVFIVDPPYLSTDVHAYNCFWKLNNYLDVLQVLKDNSYFYFTSSKSSILELCEWIEKNTNSYNPFSSAKKVEVNARMNYNSSYTDIMLYKKVIK